MSGAPAHVAFWAVRHLRQTISKRALRLSDGARRACLTRTTRLMTPAPPHPPPPPHRAVAKVIYKHDKRHTDGPSHNVHNYRLLTQDIRAKRTTRQRVWRHGQSFICYRRRLLKYPAVLSRLLRPVLHRLDTRGGGRWAAGGGRRTAGGGRRAESDRTGAEVRRGAR